MMVKRTKKKRIVLVFCWEVRGKRRRRKNDFLLLLLRRSKEAYTDKGSIRLRVSHEKQNNNEKEMKKRGTNFEGS